MKKVAEHKPQAGTLTLRVGNDIYENCILDELKATVATEEKKGGGVYDLKITAKLRYNILYDMYENNGITTINPISPKPKSEENKSESNI